MTRKGTQNVKKHTEKLTELQIDELMDNSGDVITSWRVDEMFSWQASELDRALCR